MMSSPPVQDQVKPANVTADKLDTNQMTRALPWWIGRQWFAVFWNISAPYNFHVVKTATSGGGKGGKGGGGTKQTGYCDVAGLVACGMGDFIEAIEVNGEIVWSAGGGISRDGSHPEHTGDITVADVGIFRLHWGTETAAGDWLVLNSGGEDHPYYRSKIVFEAKNLNCGQSQTVPNIRVLLERAPIVSGMDGDRNLEGANPITGIAELVADDFYGLGMPSVIDATTAIAVATALGARSKVVAVPGDPTHTASMSYYSIYLRDRQTFATLLAGVLESFDGWARRKGEKLELGYFTHPGATPGGLTELSLHDLTEDPDFPNPALDDPEVITDAIVTGPDRDYGMEDSWQAGSSDAARARLQELRTKTYARPFIITSYQQKEQAQELANFYSVPAKESTTKWRREKVGTLQPGDRFILNYSPSAVRQVFRITRRSDPASGGVVDLTIIPERGLAPLTYIAPADPAPNLAGPVAATVIAHARMLQLPQLWPGLEALPALAPLAERPSGASSGFKLHFSVADTTYDLVGETNDFALRGSLAGNLTTGTATFTINASGYDLQLLEAQSDAAKNDDTLLLICASEVMSIGAVTALGGGQYSVAVLRGRRGSAAATHSTSDEIYIIPRSELMIVTHADIPRTAVTRYFKLQSFTPGDVQDLSAALKLTVSIAASLPAAPTLTAVAGTGKAISLSWDAVDLAVRYAVYRYTSNTPSSATKISEVSALRFVDVDVTIGTAYYYWVTAIDVSGAESAKSGEAHTTPATVVGTAPDFTLSLNQSGAPFDTTTGSGSYPLGTVVAIHADATVSGHNFLQWSGAWPDIDFVQTPGSNDTYVTITKDITLTADYS